MPLVSIIVGDPSTGRSLSYLLEYQMGVNYQAIQQLRTSHLKEKKESNITRAALKEILSMAHRQGKRTESVYSICFWKFHPEFCSEVTWIRGYEPACLRSRKVYERSKRHM